jgi:hypothetical protein
VDELQTAREIRKRTAPPRPKERNMAYEPKPNTCGLFKNDRYPDRSDFTGQITIECPECPVPLECPKCRAHPGWWVNDWRKVTQAGVKYCYLALKPKGEKVNHQQFRD